MLVVGEKFQCIIQFAIKCLPIIFSFLWTAVVVVIIVVVLGGSVVCNVACGISVWMEIHIFGQIDIDRKREDTKTRWKIYLDRYIYGYFFLLCIIIFH